jgi:hypothetical protein
MSAPSIFNREGGEGIKENNEKHKTPRELAWGGGGGFYIGNDVEATSMSHAHGDFFCAMLCGSLHHQGEGWNEGFTAL